MKTLVYYVSINEEYNWLTNISIYTLLKNGQYKGDILVFADDFFINRYNVQVIRIKPEDYHPSNGKLYYADLINHDKYDQIMFIDSDIEILNNIYSLFISDNNFLYTIEPFNKIKSIPYKFCYSSYCFNMIDYLKYRNKYLVNSGLYCVDSKIFKNFINKWKSISSKFPLIFGNDQSSMNLLIYKKIFPCIPYENHLINYDGIYITDDRIINHYVGSSKSIFLKKYNFIFNKNHKEFF